MTLLKSLVFATLLLATAPLYGLPPEVAATPESGEALPASRAPEPRTALLAGLGGVVLLLVAMRRK